MNVTCPDCRTVYRVDPRKIPLGGVRARCGRCPSEFVVEEVDTATAAQEAEEVASVSASAEPFSGDESDQPQTGGITGSSAEDGESVEDWREGQLAPAGEEPQTVEYTAIEEYESATYEAEVVSGGYEFGSETDAAVEEVGSDDLPLIETGETYVQSDEYKPWGQEPPSEELAADTRGYADSMASEPAGGPMGAQADEFVAPDYRGEEEPYLAGGESSAAHEHGAHEPAYAEGSAGSAPGMESAAPQPYPPVGMVPEVETQATPSDGPRASETADLATVEAMPEGFSAVAPKRDDDLSLPPSPFGTNDPHARARRLARALVSDIVAYHPDRRSRAVQQGTIRQEFREEIRKSWEEYVAHVGNHMARDTSYFRDALNELLAGGERVF